MVTIWLYVVKTMAIYLLGKKPTISCHVAYNHHAVHSIARFIHLKKLELGVV